ncbi:MAG TPA: adenylate/guanylate cyclase domain-containing protein [Candidatus Udaeobacter sp.]|jgi:adenylate cyclase|nr:adenylate/guanylate cyclase domain-containing protein [Candidatus Udaeobacter sp.]
MNMKNVDPVVSGVKNGSSRTRYGLLLTALAPVIPQILGSVFNIWYNATVVEPLLTPALKQRFFDTVVFYNIVIYPLGIFIWVRRIFSFRAWLHRLQAAEVGGDRSPLQDLTAARRRLIHLPWFAAAICGVAWFLCIPVFLGALLQVQHPLDSRLLWHLPISFCLSGFIAVTHSFFLVELGSYWGLFPIFFRDARADRTPNIFTLSLRGHGILWAISASVCPIASLLLLMFAPQSSAVDPEWFAVFVGGVGIAFGLFTALMMSRLIAKPIDQLRLAADAVAHGKLNVDLRATGASRADEFGRLLSEFDHMVGELRDKEKLRRTFGLHVGQRAAEQILARDPGLSGVEEDITVMFVDMRSWTARASVSDPADVVEVMNDFFRVTVRVVEEDHRGMVNKYLGDGFMAIFGASGSTSNHTHDAVAAGRQILRAVEELNDELAAKGRAPIKIGIGIHCGPAIVGSIGSPQRLEFTAMGNTVNIASRIEALTKTTGRQLLVTAAVRDRSDDSFSFEALPPQEVRGIEEPMAIFAVR